ncbi:MAG: acyl-protein synthetase [Bacteroidetes bacterium]|nr:acyl-protein synthetase [Bacteroidota bacterium]
MENQTTEKYLNSQEIENFLMRDAFGYSDAEKPFHLLPLLRQLHELHLQNSTEYSAVYEKVFHHREINNITDLPFLPVSIFKEMELKSISNEQVFKVLTSSGTTGQVPSRIYLDGNTAKIQTKTLSRIMAAVLGKERLPMLVVDSKSVLSNRTSFSARGAGILGMSVFGRDHHYLLDDNMETDAEIWNSFLEKYDGKPIFIFGFTFMIWKFLLPELKKRKVDLSQAILVHSGGWKKLTERAVDNPTFKSVLNQYCGMQRIHNFYGMVEQVGTVFLENKLGFLHCPSFSDIIIRDPSTLDELPDGKEGLIQVLSCLPASYPGHSLLTEDIGVIEGRDHPGLDWKGKYFRIIGRAKKAELRGCSDTFKKA